MSDILRFKWGLWLISLAIFSQAWLTVEGFLPPNSAPIWISERLVSFLMRYIAACRARAVSLSLLRPARSITGIWKHSATASSTRAGVGGLFVGGVSAIFSSALAASAGVGKSLSNLA